MPIVIPVQDHQACIPILPGQYRLLLETGNGTLISDHKAYTLQRLMYPERFIKRLEHLSPLSLPFILADFAEKKEAADYSLDDVKRMQRLYWLFTGSLQGRGLRRTFCRTSRLWAVGCKDQRFCDLLIHPAAGI